MPSSLDRARPSSSQSRSDNPGPGRAPERLHRLRQVRRRGLEKGSVLGEERGTERETGMGPQNLDQDPDLGREARILGGQEEPELPAGRIRRQRAPGLVDRGPRGGQREVRAQGPRAVPYRSCGEIPRGPPFRKQSFPDAGRSSLRRSRRNGLWEEIFTPDAGGGSAAANDAFQVLPRDKSQPSQTVLLLVAIRWTTECAGQPTARDKVGMIVFRSM